MPQPRLSPRPARLADGPCRPRVGLHQCPSEKIRPRERACGQPILSHVPTHAQSAAKARDFSRAARLSTGETDSPLEGTGFEPSVPPRKRRPSGEAPRPTIVVSRDDLCLIMTHRVYRSGISVRQSQETFLRERYRRFESGSLQQTVRFSRDFFLLYRKAGSCRGVRGHGQAARPAETRRLLNITPAAGKVSVGRFSSTAVPARAVRPPWLQWCAKRARSAARLACDQL
jgi:hypothetical protein